MDEMITCVYKTTDYEKFKKLECNRKVDSMRLKRLIKSISTKEILNPIIVNEHFEIIDGQGRYEAKKKLGKPIYYIIVEGADIKDCRRMNEYNQPWTISEFIESYAEKGDKSYIRLKNLYEETKQPYARLLRLSNHSGGEGSYKVRAGELEFTDEDVTMVRNILSLAEEISDALQVSKRLNDAFYTGIKVMTEYEGYLHTRMIKNCKACRSSYCQMSNLENQLKEFSRIYNFKTSKNKLYFEDYMRNRGYNVRSYDEESSFKTSKDDKSTLQRRKK